MNIQNEIPSDQKIFIKLEVDSNPPLGAGIETQLGYAGINTSPISPAWLVKALGKRVSDIERLALEIWSERFFLAKIKKLGVYL